MCFAPMKKSPTITLLLALVMSSTSVLADPDPKRSPARDEIVLAQGAINRLEKNLADKADWAKDRAARERARTSIQMVEPALARIQKADAAWDLTRWNKLLADAKARLAAADGALAKDAADKKAVDNLVYEYSSAVSRVHEAMELLQTIDRKPASLEPRTADTVARTLAGIAQVKSVDELCKVKNLASLAAAGDTYRNPAVGCPLAARYRELGGKYLELQVRNDVAREAASFQQTVEKAKAGESIEIGTHQYMLAPANAIAAMRTRFEAAGKDLGLVVDEAWLEPISAATTGYRDALAEGARTSRWDPRAKLAVGQIAAQIAGDYKPGGELEKGKVLRVAAFHDWSVETDYTKRPVSRSRSVQVLVKIDGETFCRVYGRELEAKFSNGKWGPAYGKGISSFRVSACK